MNIHELTARFEELRSKASKDRRTAAKLRRRARLRIAKCDELIEGYLEEYPYELRDIRGDISQTTIARRAGVVQSTVSNLENAKFGNISHKKLVELLRVYTAILKERNYAGGTGAVRD